MGYLEGILLNDEREKENQPMMECPSCDGSGAIDKYYNEYDIYSIECPQCLGEGEVELYD